MGVVQAQGCKSSSKRMYLGAACETFELVVGDVSHSQPLRKRLRKMACLFSFFINFTAIAVLVDLDVDVATPEPR